MTVNTTSATNGPPNLAIDQRSSTQSPKHLPPEFYEHFLSNIARERKPGPINGLLHLENKPGMLSLLAGKPNDAVFPFESFSFTVTDPLHPSHSIPISLSGSSLSEGLQYGQMAGLPRLIDWFVGLQERAHGRKLSEGWGLTIGGGSQDVIYKAANAILNPGDPILIEAPVFAGVFAIFTALHCETVEVATDENGICSSDLRSTLENWPEGKQKPKVFYTVPCGCNPTGMTTATERRREVLQLAREHNFLILEDDPYYYVYFGEDERPPSYFALELEMPELGRVIRFDSLSKVISPGMRLGFVSGPKRFIDVINNHTSYANIHCSFLVQAIVLALLEKWGYEGFFAHMEAVARFYKERRDVFEKAMQTHLEGLAEWRTPEAGMYFWFKLLMNPDPNEEGDSKELIQTKALENGVLALPGTVFFPNGRRSAYVRASFSLLTTEEINEALRRLRVVLLREREGK